MVLVGVLGCFRYILTWFWMVLGGSWWFWVVRWVWDGFGWFWMVFYGFLKALVGFWWFFNGFGWFGMVLGDLGGPGSSSLGQPGAACCGPFKQLIWRSGCLDYEIIRWLDDSRNLGLEKIAWKHDWSGVEDCFRSLTRSTLWRGRRIYCILWWNTTNK